MLLVAFSGIATVQEHDHWKGYVCHYCCSSSNVVSGQLPEMTRSRLAQSQTPQSQTTQSRVDTFPNGHNPEWTRSRFAQSQTTQSRVYTIPNGHHPEWAQSAMDTIRNGHHPK